MTEQKPVILYVDDVKDNLLLVERFLASEYHVETALDGKEGLEKARNLVPSLILLDIMMPEMDGYEVCAHLQSDESTAFIPVVFLTALGEEKDKARAFSVGAADYMVKPIRKKLLIEKIEKHLETNLNWSRLHEEGKSWQHKIQPSDFVEFQDFLCEKLKVSSEVRFKISKTIPSKLYSTLSGLGIPEETVAQQIAKFTGLPYLASINPESVELGTLPAAFCKSNHVVALENPEKQRSFVLSNPFDLELMDTLANMFRLEPSSDVSITHPQSIDSLLGENTFEARRGDAPGTVAPQADSKTVDALAGIDKELRNSPIIKITNSILTAAVKERASDIHIEPKENETIVRFRVDGDLRNAFTLKSKTGIMVISRLKIISGMDIAEKRKPQDGGFVVELFGRTFNLRLSTTSTPNGESLVMRLLEPYAEPKPLEDLGMLKVQSRTMVRVANKTSGIILIVGATGSGKTTTIYSLLHNIDYDKRSLMSVEDPVEYRMPFVNQQQVNEKAGVTFDALLKTAVRQDPDVLFMGEIRDNFSARIAIDFASTGHLTISTLHTSNATSAIFRLGRLGVERGIMASSILAVVAQKLVKKLCPYCKKATGISDEEVEMFRPFTDDIPSEVGRPVGCEKCSNTGYLGREAVYEVLEFDPDVTDLVRSEASVAEIRDFVRDRGNYLLSTHAIHKVRNLTVSPKDAYKNVLAEELTERDLGSSGRDEKVDRSAADNDSKGEGPGRVEASVSDSDIDAEEVLPGETGQTGKKAILVVDDDDDTRKLLTRHLENADYQVFSAGDGIEALLQLGSRTFDLILSDVDMPNLDGFKLLEMTRQKKISTPVVLLTSRSDPEDEEKGLELGAMDYIKKPPKKEVLLLRVKRIFQMGV